MARVAALAAALAALALGACGDDTRGAKTTEGVDMTGAEGATEVVGPPVEIRDVQACLTDDGHDVQRNTGTVGESTGDLVVDYGASGVVYVFEDAGAAEDGEADVREYEDYSPYRDYEIEVVSNTVIGYETEPSAERLRACIAG